MVRLLRQKSLNCPPFRQGSLVQIYGGDPIPAHNVLRTNGRLQRSLAGYWPGANMWPTSFMI